MAPPQTPAAGAFTRSRIILRSTELANGMNSADIQLKRRKREWVGLRPGAYVAAAALDTLDDVQRHLLLIEATMRSLIESSVISHQSAACLHGITQLRPNLRAVQVTRPGAGGTHRRASLHTFRARLDPDDIVIEQGYRVTSPERTILDLARSGSLESGLAAADSAARLQLTQPDRLRAAVERIRQRPGSRQALQVIAMADPRSESVGESVSRARLWQAGIPTPTPQLVVRSSNGAVLGRCDFGWEEHRTVAEFDGAVKYGRLLRPGQRAGDVVFKEKVREDRIRDEGWQFVRWTWDELKDPEIISTKLWRAFERAGRIS